MILILSSHDDVHTKSVSQHLDRAGAEHRVLDLSEFPREAAVSLRYGVGSGSDFHFLGGDTLHLEDVSAVWWRRPQPYGIDPSITDREHARFAFTECHETMIGLWHGLDAEWMNDPALDERAHRKTYQWRVAESVGLEMPETVVTNHPVDARAFAARHGAGGTVYKAFSATPRVWRETRVLDPGEIDLLELVQLAPVIFQEYIPGVDIRVTVVGDEIFAAEIDARDTTYPVDFRMNFDEVAIVATELPEELKEQILELRRRLGLVYGALDFRRTKDGRYVFLEINPAGQWLFVEHATGLDISGAVANMLSRAAVPTVRRSVIRAGIRARTQAERSRRCP